MSAALAGSEVDAIRIEEAGLNALQTQRQLFYDGWVLRVSPGKAKRARSVNPHFGSRLPLPEKIAHCEALYARFELPTLFRITPFAQPPELARALAERGYEPFDTTLVQTVTLDRPPAAHAAHDAVACDISPGEFAEAAGTLRDSTPAQRAAHRERLDASPLDSRFVVVTAHGETVCTAQMAAEGDLAGVFDVITAPEVRNRGYASVAVASLLAWAWDRATRRVYLQVTATNAAALGVYRKFGFETLYTYHYCARPGEAR